MDRIAEAMKALAAMSDDMPEIVKTPWSAGVWSYATDNRAAIRAERLEEFGERPSNVETAASLDAILDGAAGPTWYDIPAMPPAPGTCPKCHGATRVKCEACEGDGRVEWEFEYGGRTYDMDADCPVCDGDGRVKCSRCAGSGVMPDPGVEVGPALIDPRYLRLMARLPGCRLAPVDGRSVIVFRFVGGAGAVMPMWR